MTEQADRKANFKRVPEHGWDNGIDIRRANKFLRDTGDTVPHYAFGIKTAAELAKGEKPMTEADVKDATVTKLRPYVRALRSFGLRPRTTIKKLLDFFRFRVDSGEIQLDWIKAATVQVYSKESNPPGMESAAGQKVPDGMAFVTNALGRPLPNHPGNIGVAFLLLGVELKYDSFADRYSITGLKDFGPAFDDAAVNRLRFLISEKYGFTPDRQMTFDYCYDLARYNAFDPVNEYFDCVQEKWDHKPRIETFLIDYAGAKDTPYVRAVSKLLFLAVVKRNREPGAKFDEMIVLESSQGKDKSSALEVLALKPDWFSDSFPLNAANRETLEHGQGKIIIEVPELQGMRKAEVEHVKAMLSRTTDRGRLAYARNPIEAARRFIFVGTSNGREYLQDQTGNRRFWPVAVAAFDLAAVRRDCDQLWGEAAFRDALGFESIRLDRSLWAAAGIEQDKRMAAHGDPFADTFREYLGDKAGRIKSDDAWTILGVDPGRRTPELNRRFGAALKAIGWRPITVKLDRGKGGHRTRGYGNGTATRRIVAYRPARGPLVVGYEDDLAEGVTGEFDQAEADFG